MPFASAIFAVYSRSRFLDGTLRWGPWIRFDIYDDRAEAKARAKTLTWCAVGGMVVNEGKVIPYDRRR
jgi:hypothetical protein